MGFFSKLFGKDEPQQSREKRTLFNLQQGDILTYDLEEFEVVGKLTYNDSGYKWMEYHIKSVSRNLWLSVEQDDDLEVEIYEKIKTKFDVPNSHEVTFDGVTYFREETGTAYVEEVWGQAGAVVGQRVSYWDYEAEEDDLEYEYLCFEQWGPDLEISRGYSISEREIEIFATN